jgi:hypothetical protein
MSLACAILCAQFLGQVAAAAAPNTASHNRFTVAPGESPGDARFSIYAADLARAMAAQGFEAAEAPEQANLVVRLSYAASGPLKRIISEAGAMDAPGGGPRPTASRSMITSGGGGFGGEDEPSAPETVTRAVTYYQRTVTVAAYILDPAAPADAAPRMLWQTRVRSDGDKPALQDAVPAMIAMAGPYLARTTGKVVDARIDDRDPELKRIRGAAK